MRTKTEMGGAKVTPEEAIKLIRDNLGKLIAPYSDEMDAFGMAIEALEKQIPKKPKLVTRAGGIIKFYPCPNCSTPEKYVSVYPRTKHCVECGQKLKWEDE